MTIIEQNAHVVNFAPPETIGMIEQRVISDAADLAVVGKAVRVLEIRENKSFLSKRELALITATFHETSR